MFLQPLRKGQATSKNRCNGIVVGKRHDSMEKAILPSHFSSDKVEPRINPTDGRIMKITLVGSKYFGQEVLSALAGERGVDIVRIVAPAADDRLALAAKARGIEVVVHADPHVVGPEHIAPDTGLIVTAHCHARVTPAALAKARLGGIGYHPSLLPRHRGIAAIEWTIKEGDPIAGGSIYHLADRMDAGPLAAQDWCFVRKGETARQLWERALAPMGLRLLQEVVRNAAETGEVPAIPQQEEFATKAPLTA